MAVNNFFSLVSQAAQWAPSADNSQPWQLAWHDSTLSVSYDEKRVNGRTFSADNPATLLSMGAVMENIAQAAQACKCPLNWEIESSLNAHNPVYFRALFDDKAMGEIPVESLRLFSRHTNRFPYHSKPLPKSLLADPNTLKTPRARAIVIDAPNNKIKDIAQLVRQASEIRFRTKDVHEWLAKSLRFDPASVAAGDGLDVSTIALPPGGSAFLRLISDWKRMAFFNRFGAYKALAMIDANPVKQAPTLLAVLAPNDFQAILSAGQLMTRLWIDLNAQGIAVQPFYVVADQLHRRRAGTIPIGMENQADAIFERTKQLLQLEDGESLQMLLRIGYPKKTPVLSHRLPLKSVCNLSV